MFLLDILQPCSRMRSGDARGGGAHRSIANCKLVDTGSVLLSRWRRKRLLCWISSWAQTGTLIPTSAPRIKTGGTKMYAACGASGHSLLMYSFPCCRCASISCAVSVHQSCSQTPSLMLVRPLSCLLRVSEIVCVIQTASVCICRPLPQGA